MQFYRLKRHVIWINQETSEVWGIDRAAPFLETKTAPRYTDHSDPLGTPCALLLVLDGEYVSWHRLWEWLSYAYSVGYSLVTTDLTPYSTVIIRS
jgi:hypothetical protein